MSYKMIMRYLWTMWKGHFKGFFGSLASPKYDYWGDKTHPLGNFGLFSLPASFFRGNYPRTAKKKLFEGKWSLLPSFRFLTLDCITKETGRETLISRISRNFLNLTWNWKRVWIWYLFESRRSRTCSIKSINKQKREWLAFSNNFIWRIFWISWKSITWSLTWELAWIVLHVEFRIGNFVNVNWRIIQISALFCRFCLTWHLKTSQFFESELSSQPITQYCVRSIKSINKQNPLVVVLHVVFGKFSNLT